LEAVSRGVTPLREGGPRPGMLAIAPSARPAGRE